MKKKKINESSFGAFGGGVDPTIGGASYNVQGSGPGYVYSILPFNNSLQQKTNVHKDEYYIYPGCKVRGVGYNNPDLHYTGIVNRIVKDENGVIRFLYIKTIKTNKFVSIAADDNLELILNQSTEPPFNLSSNNFEISNNMRL